jgi:periplasmic protein TonB
MNRYIVSFVCAPIIVVALVWVMFQLTVFKPVETPMTQPAKVITELHIEDFPTPEDEIVEVIAPKLTLPAKPTIIKPPSYSYEEDTLTEQQTAPENTDTFRHQPDLLKEVDYADTTRDTLKNAEGLNKASSTQASSTQLNPMYTVKPRYPNKARRKGIEGYVAVVFDVSVIGTVENIRVESAKPRNVFEQYAIKAIKTWKYEPLIVDGIKHSFKDKRVVLDFKIVE